MMNTNLPPLPKSRKLDETEADSTTGSYTEYNPYSVQPFVEGMSEYDEYQQAWRLLGFMIDCNGASDDDENSGSGSEDTTEDGCARYVLWAAYVDLDYEGGGIGEYQYWDRDSQSWNATACNYAEGGDSRCAKMDCHLEDTNFSVLGFFKHKNYDDWMEQLFKHEGMCVWSEEEYAFMKNARKAWPQGCVDTGSTNAEGDNLYYNIKPSTYGRINLALYTDTQCLEEYPVSTDAMEDIIGNLFAGGGSGSGDNGDYDFSEDSLADSMERWHSAFDVWHTCHPCVAYDIENTDGTKYTDDDDDYNYYNGYYNNRRKLGGEYSAEGDVFECYDDAGYTNVNQCMKFSAKTVMNTATFRDLSLGKTQATLAEYPLSGFYENSDKYKKDTIGNIRTYAFLGFTMIGLIYSLYNLVAVWKGLKAKEASGENENSLLS